MIRTCSDCGMKEGTHRWGRWWLCDKCHEERLKTHKTKTGNVDIKIHKKTEFLGGPAYYMQGSGEIYFCGELRGFPLEVVLHHEIMHHILNVFIDPPTSYDYDNISPNGKIDRFAVCDE